MSFGDVSAQRAAFGKDFPAHLALIGWSFAVLVHSAPHLRRDPCPEEHYFLLNDLQVGLHAVLFSSFEDPECLWGQCLERAVLLPHQSIIILASSMK